MRGGAILAIYDEELDIFRVLFILNINLNMNIECRIKLFTFVTLFISRFHFIDYA